MPASPKLFVTAATGQLGGHVIDVLLETVPADAIIAGVREAANESEAAQALRAKGVETRLADYGRPDQLASALEGVDRLLLISSSENGRRKQQHRNVIDAAKSADVDLIAYTSILRADASPLFLAEEHRDTEAALAESGAPFVLLRNGWYNEVFTWRLPLALKTGVLMGATGAGRIASAAPTMPGLLRPCFSAKARPARPTNWRATAPSTWRNLPTSSPPPRARR